MAELTTLARPYAKAAFESAREQKALDSWSSSLDILDAVASDSKVANLLDSPTLTAEQKVSLLTDICGDKLDAQVQKFVTILAQNKRLDLIASIGKQFKDLKAQQEKFCDVEVISAFALDSEVEKSLADKLKTVLLSDVSLETKIDQSLIGGVIVRSGDTVIDGSIRGRLNKLSESLDIHQS